MFRIFIKGFVLILVTVVGFICYSYFFAGGKTDFYYSKFTTEKAPSLVLGSSRATRGIAPRVFNEAEFFQYSKPVNNFGFTISNSRYGPVYLNAIKNKIETTSKLRNGLFILEVNPFVVSTTKKNVTDQAEDFMEKDNFLAKMKSFDIEPNFEYIAKVYAKPYYNILLHDLFKEKTIVLKDGFLVTKPIRDMKEIENRTVSKISAYIDLVADSKPSKTRLEYLEETILFLKGKGMVFLVRVPIDGRMLDLENKYYSGFDLKMERLSGKYGATYLNFASSGEFKTDDGNHLDCQSAYEFSKILLDSICRYIEK